MIEDAVESWITGQLALSLLAVDPVGLKGLHVRARAGAVRDAFLKDVPPGLRPLRKIAPIISDTQLFGGIDISATLAAGQVVLQRGLLAEPRSLMLTMAERCPAGLGARLAQALDAETGHLLILLDEGADEDEHAPEVLTDRIAFRLDLDGLRASDLAEIALDPQDIVKARAQLPAVAIPDDALAMLVVTALRFGIDSMRAPLLAVACARAHAALSGRSLVGQDDLSIAAQLVYAHRATMVPQEREDTAEPEDRPEQPEDPHSPEPQNDSLELPEDLLIEAVKALLPPDILDRLRQARPGKGTKGAAGAGQKKKGNRRGRPLPSRQGHPSGDRRIDIVATLRAAAPWQPLRRKQQPDATGILIRPSDIHIRQFQEMSDRLVIFAVDASGSSAMARLNEAKGAVELMLGQAYAKRDHVALIAFRGEGAEVILPPTRSLVQTKRRLAGLPGGGGTPLAAGLRAAADLARHARTRGLSPSVAVLTDGRANVPLPGRTGRQAAREDAEAMARQLRSLEVPTVLVDIGNRPQADLAALATMLGGGYVPLPRADAQRLNRAVGLALGA